VFGGWSSPGPTAEAYSAPQSSSWIPREGKKRGGKGAKDGNGGDGREGEEMEEGKGRERVGTGKQA